MMTIRPFAVLLLGFTACQSVATRTEAVILSGPALVSGTQSEFRIEFGPDEAWRMWLGGPLGSEWVSDGERAWERSWNNPARELHGAEREFLLIMMSAMRDGRHDSAPGGLDVVAELDPESGHLLTLRRAEEGLENAVRFEDWSVRDGVRVPARIRRGDLEGVHDVLEVHEVGRESVAGFAPPADPPRDWSFTAGAAPELELRVAASGHLLVHPRVDGQDVGWFIFDSGAGAMCLDAGLTERLGAERFGRVTAIGVAGRAETDFTRTRSFTLGPMTLDEPIFVLLDLAFLAPYFEVPIAGIVGHELFARAVVEYETAPDPRISLHAREDYRLIEGARWEPMIVSERIPIVRARFEGGHEDWFRLDTGANGTVAFHAPAVERYGLLDARATTPAQAGGVGGSGEVRVGRLAWLELGGARFEEFDAQFYVGEVGAFADADTCGNLGLDLLRNFRLVFDARGERIAFLPR